MGDIQSSYFLLIFDMFINFMFLPSRGSGWILGAGLSYVVIHALLPRAQSLGDSAAGTFLCLILFNGTTRSFCKVK